MRTATYISHGEGRSLAARDAERNGQLPLTRAIPVVAAKAGVSRRRAREALLAVGPVAWHHTGKYARETDYYAVDHALNWLAVRPLFSRLPADWEDQIEAAIRSGGDDLTARHAAIEAVTGRLAAAVGSTAEVITAIYYETWAEIEAVEAQVLASISATPALQ